MASRRMSRRARSLAAVSISAFALAACNLLTGLDAEYELKSGEGVGGEGGTDDADQDGAAPDGASDAPPGLDAGDGGTSSFCESARDGSTDEDFFCADFENGTGANGVPLGWMRAIDTFDGGTIRIVANAGKDGSHALEVTSDTAAISRQTRLYKELPRVQLPEEYLRYEVEFQFKLQESSLDYAAFGLLVFEPQVKAKEHGLAGYASTPAHKLARQAVTGNTSPPLTFPNDGEWHQATISLEHTAAGMPFTREIKVDSVDVDEVPTDHATEPSTMTQLWLGVFNTSTNSGGSHILFDNVVFRRRR